MLRTGNEHPTSSIVSASPPQTKALERTTTQGQHEENIRANANWRRLAEIARKANTALEDRRVRDDRSRSLGSCFRFATA